MKAPTSSPNKPQEPPRNTATEAHNLPTFYPLFSNVSLLLPYYGIAKHRENTTPLQIILNFCPLSAYFAHLLPLLSGPQVVRLPSSAQVLPECSHSPEMQGTRGKEPEQQGNEKGNEAEREAHKPTSPQKRAPPPIGRAQTAPPPHHKFAPKNQQKSRLGCFEKIFGKIFRGNVSGERKTPRVISTEGGSLNK